MRAFVPPKTNYYQCPLKRRAAVLILLFADRVGDLRVILTIRSAGLKNCEFVLWFSLKMSWGENVLCWPFNDTIVAWFKLHDPKGIVLLAIELSLQ